MSLIRPSILGGVDGIITSFAIVVSCHAAGFDTRTVLVIGVASLIADGASMGISEYLSSRASNVRVDFNKRQLEEGLESGEKKKMIAELETKIINEEGLSKTQAHRLASILSNHPPLFARISGLDVDKSSSPAWILGIACMASFIICGAVPIIAYVPVRSISITIVASLCLLILLGLLREPHNRLNSLLTTCVLGIVAGAIAYGAARLTAIIESS